MNAQTQFALMCAAMTGPDEWLEAIQDEIDSLPEEFQWEDDPHYEDTVEYIHYQNDIEFMRRGM